MQQPSNAVVWGIDPGTRESGVVCWDGVKVLYKAILPNIALLSLPFEAGSIVVIEAMQMYSKSGIGNDVFDTLIWNGRIFEYATQRGAYPRFMHRSTVRMFHCRTMDSGDPQVRQALIDSYGPASTKANPNPNYGGDYKNKMASHMWNALALAVIPGRDRILFERKSFTIPRA